MASTRVTNVAATVAATAAQVAFMVEIVAFFLVLT